MRKKLNIKYTTMCIYIDEHVYEKDHDVDKIFNYLQCLFYALAYKQRLFTKVKDYEDYSLYGATCVYMRLINPKQFLPEDDPKHMPKVKSVLNYIKTALYPLKVNFQQENFTKVFSEDHEGLDTINSIKDSLEATVNAGNRGLLIADVNLYLRDIPKVIKSFLNDSIYANDSLMLHRLYISILITILRTITLSNHNYQKLIGDNDVKSNVEELVAEALVEEKTNSPLAWHVNGMEDYIYVSANKIIKIIIKDIRELIKSYEPSEEMIKDILMSPLSELNNED